MTNLTEEDVKFICEFLLAPLSKEVDNAIEEYDKDNAEVLERLFDGIIKQIDKIRYEQERDRRFFIGFFAEYARMNKDALHDFYKSWCEEFDKLNKEKIYD